MHICTAEVHLPCGNAGVYLEKSIVRAAFEYSIRENVSLSGFLGDECVTMRHTPEIQVDCHCEAHLHAVLHSSIQSFIHSFKVSFIHVKFHSSIQNFIHPFIHTSFLAALHSFVRSFISSLIHAFTQKLYLLLLLQSFVHRSVCSYICSFLNR